MNRRTQSALTPAQVDERQSRIYYYWLLLALFVEYARPASFAPILQIPLIYTLIPMGLFVATFSAKGLRPIPTIMRDPMMKWILFYVALVSVSVLYAIVSEFSLNMFKFSFGFGILCFLIARIVTTEARMFGVVGALLVAHLFLLAMNPEVITNPETRNYIVGATFLGDGNDFGLSLCILVPCTIDIALRARTFTRKLLLWGGVVLMLLAIVSTQSRGASLGIGAVFAYMWLTTPRKGVTLVAILIALGIGLMYAPSNYFDRMATLSDYQNEGSAQSRIVLWKAGTRMALANPVFGVGAGNFPVAFGTRFKPPDVVGWKNAHSAYFQVWGELGTVGAITFLGILFGNFSRNARLRKALLNRPAERGKPDPARALQARRLYVLNAGWLGFMVAGAFLSAAYYPHIFILTGLCVAARAIATEETGVNIDTAQVRGRRSRRGSAAPAAGENASAP